MKQDENKRTEFFLQKIEEIPSLPNVVLELMRLIDNPMTSTRQIEQVLEVDQGLSLKVLKLANSAYYAIPGGATSMKRALTFLGLNTVKQIVVSAAVANQFKKLDSPQFNLTEFWKHSVGVGITAEVIAKHLKIRAPEEAFVCGLVHDLGKLALLMIDKEKFLKTGILANEKNLTFLQAEIELEAPRHAHWGQVLAKKWKLPILLQSAIRDHHVVSHSLRLTPDPESNQIVDIIYISNQWMHHSGFGDSGYKGAEALNPEVLGRLGLKQEDEQLETKIKESLAHAEPLIKALTG